MVSKPFSDPSQHQQELGIPSIESLIEGYHSKLLTLYQPVWSCPWPRETDPVLGTVEGLEIHELSLWQEAISTLFGETLVLQKLAGELMVEGRQGEALAIYRQLVDADPENPQVLHNLAGAFLLCGNAPEAERIWRQIMALDPTWEEPRLALAQVLLDRQEWAEAEVYFNRLDPSGPWAFTRNLSLAFIHTKSDLTSLQEQGKREFESLVDQGFVGISLYVFTNEDVGILRDIDDEIWQWLVDNKWLISVNSKGDLWLLWMEVLKRNPNLTLLISHIGLITIPTKPASEDEIAIILKTIASLMNFSNVYLKLSGFYALEPTDPVHAYRLLDPYIRYVVEKFSVDRLIWGSDFPLSLDKVSFGQTFENLNYIEPLKLKNILENNLQRLLR